MEMRLSDDISVLNAINGAGSFTESDTSNATTGIAILSFGSRVSPEVDRIDDLATMSLRLESICNNIFQDLGSQQREFTYQSALRNDLRRAKVIVDEEVPIVLTRHGEEIGRRYADLVVTLASNNERAVIEIKAVQSLGHDHCGQLKFYMQALKIRHGFLINFPHDKGFQIDDSFRFFHRVLSNNVDLERIMYRRSLWFATANVEIVHVHAWRMSTVEHHAEYLLE